MRARLIALAIENDKFEEYKCLLTAMQGTYGPEVVQAYEKQRVHRTERGAYNNMDQSQEYASSHSSDDMDINAASDDEKEMTRRISNKKKKVFGASGGDVIMLPQNQEQNAATDLNCSISGKRSTSRTA